jgi:hypothetical protein
MSWNEHLTSAVLLLVLSLVLLPTRGTIESFYRRARDPAVPSEPQDRWHTVTRSGLRTFFRVAFSVALALALGELLLGFFWPNTPWPR